MIQCRLIGQNIQRSQSPNFHNTLAEKLNIDLHYQLEELTANSAEILHQHTTHLFKNDIDSANITYPYKEWILSVADQLAPCAKRVGAANTLIKRDQKIIAYNTDYSGFIAAFNQFGQQKPGKVVVLGCGGVGKAICFSLADLGAEEIAIYDRDLTKMDSLAKLLAADNIDTVCLNETTLETAVQNAQGILNCTPIGHYQTPGCPINPAWLQHQTWCFDAVYTPRETDFIKANKQKGIDTLSGFELFFHQAHDAFTLFTDTQVSAQQLNTFKQIQLANLR